MKKQILYIAWMGLLLIFAVEAQGQHTRKSKKRSTSTEYSCPLIDSIIDFSMTKLGCVYQSGGTGPNGFDCSGLMYYTFGQFNIRLGRSSRDQFLMGEKVEREEIRRGDLVFWYRGKNYIGHVGLVVAVDSANNFQFIHSATHGKGVRLDYSTGKWYSTAYAGARRIITCDDSGRAFMVEGKQKSELTDVTMPESTLELSSEERSDSIQSKTEVVTPSQSAEKVVYHKVKSGDTLYSIARKYKVTVAKLKEWNQLESDTIRTGDRLKIEVSQ